MSSSNVSSRLESLKTDLAGQGVRFDNISDLMLLVLSEMRSTNTKVAYGLGAGGFAGGVIVTLLIGLTFIHIS